MERPRDQTSLKKEKRVTYADDQTSVKIDEDQSSVIPQLSQAPELITPPLSTTQVAPNARSLTPSKVKKVEFAPQMNDILKQVNANQETK